MGEGLDLRSDEVAALRLGVDLGMSLIDTAEVYADGGAEEIVGEAIAGRRDEVFIVGQVSRTHASRLGVTIACAGSLKRLGTDRIDLYLLHQRSRTPLAETVAAFEALKAAGDIRHWGVSNFDASDMAELAGLPEGKFAQASQVLYNLKGRSVEHDLVPWCRERGIPVIAYSPMAQGVLSEARLVRIAERYGASQMQIALAWLVRQDGVIAIPKASKLDHVRANRAAHDIRLIPADLQALDRIFPRKRKSPIEMT